MITEPHTFKDSIAEMFEIEAEDRLKQDEEDARNRDRDDLAAIIRAAIGYPPAASDYDAAAADILAAGWSRPRAQVG